MTTSAQTTDPTITPASCWPYDFLCDFTVRPKAVLVAEVRERATNAFVGHLGIDWDFIDKNGVPHIRVRNVHGLPPGKSYTITVLVLKE